MGKNTRRRHKPQRPSASNVRPLPRRQPVVSGVLAVEAADAAASVGQLEDESNFPLDSSDWVTAGYVYRLLCEMPRYVGYPNLAAEDLEAEVRSGGVPVMRQCLLHGRDRKLIGPARELLKRSHWDEHKFFVRSDGRLEVSEGAFRSTARIIFHASVKGYAYFVWKPAIAERWPSAFASAPSESKRPPRRVTAIEWITYEAQRLKRTNKIPAGINKTEFAQLLADNMRAAAKTDDSIVLKPVGQGYILNQLKAWGLWPIAAIE